ncbi:hypothetical protein CEXT_566641 [Caerostris extrusa]|uniref:Uncharacterized protein n=1 Tax=Caerostris extrusa TaxID=172846 RepID=A0AAV4WN08_CAEEX|nr:hypothetical protein CEXT_566641 [Caerostris extrusa]
MMDQPQVTVVICQEQYSLDGERNEATRQRKDTSADRIDYIPLQAPRTMVNSNPTLSCHSVGYRSSENEYRTRIFALLLT